MNNELNQPCAEHKNKPQQVWHYQYQPWGIHCYDAHNTQNFYCLTITSLRNNRQLPIKVVETQSVDRQNERIIESEQNIAALGSKQEKYHKNELLRLRESGYYMINDPSVPNNSKAMKAMVDNYKLELFSKEFLSALLHLLPEGDIYCWKSNYKKKSKDYEETIDMQVIFVCKIHKQQRSQELSKTLLDPQEVEEFNHISKLKHRFHLSPSGLLVPKFSNINLPKTTVQRSIWTKISNLFYDPSVNESENGFLGLISTPSEINGSRKEEGHSTNPLVSFFDIKTKKRYSIKLGQHLCLKLTQSTFNMWFDLFLDKISEDTATKEEGNQKGNGELKEYGAHVDRLGRINKSRSNLPNKILFISRKKYEGFTEVNNHELSKYRFGILNCVKDNYLDTASKSKIYQDLVKITRKVYEEILLPINKIIQFSDDIDTVLNSFIEWHMEIMKKEQMEEQISLLDFESIDAFFSLLQSYYLSSDHGRIQDKKHRRPGLPFHLLNQFIYRKVLDPMGPQVDSKTSFDPRTRIDPSGIDPRQLLCVVYFDVYKHLTYSPDIQYTLVIDDPRLFRVLSHNINGMFADLFAFDKLSKIKKVNKFDESEQYNNGEFNFNIVCRYHPIDPRALSLLYHHIPVIETAHSNNLITTSSMLTNANLINPFTKCFLTYKANSVQIVLDTNKTVMSTRNRINYYECLNHTHDQQKNKSMTSPHALLQLPKKLFQFLSKYFSSSFSWIYLKLSRSQQLSKEIIWTPLKSVFDWLDDPDTIYPLIITQYGLFTMREVKK